MMNRRQLLAAAVPASLIPLVGPFVGPALAGGPDTVKFKPGVIADALAEGRTVFVDYAADWCSTCARQERVIASLRRENPAYNAMLFVRVDWDTYKRHEVTTSRSIPRRSTLLLLKGDQEIARLVSETREAEIRAFLDRGLAEASS